MSCFVESKGELMLPKQNLDLAYKRMCALNADDDIKRGGKLFRSETLIRPEGSESIGHPDVWFSWMPWDFDIKFSTAREIIECLGFKTDETGEGLLIYGYGDKKGQEDIFFQAIGDLLEPDREMLWTSGYDETWRWRTYPGGIDTDC